VEEGERNKGEVESGEEDVGVTVKLGENTEHISSTKKK